ncbi:DUF397 domain-containing protein [Streptomyces sp. bgisy100]|uniref:DUF397 domain-containing protein n=1 Tax=Streptomyces sp. bgisy100 TaxID=3413783 RepID=UPI003D710D39
MNRSDRTHGEWFKSSYSNQNANCVEVLIEAEAVRTRDTKDRSGPALTFSTGEWQAFVAGVADGEFDA